MNNWFLVMLALMCAAVWLVLDARVRALEKQQWELMKRIERLEREPEDAEPWSEGLRNILSYSVKNARSFANEGVRME